MGNLRTMQEELCQHFGRDRELLSDVEGLNRQEQLKSKKFGEGGEFYTTKIYRINPHNHNLEIKMQQKRIKLAAQSHHQTPGSHNCHLPIIKEPIATHRIPLNCSFPHMTHCIGTLVTFSFIQYRLHMKS